MCNANAIDLQLIFGKWLQHRFDGLPIHKLVYYQSYYQGVLQKLIAAIHVRSGQRWTLRYKLDSTGNQQDCPGMTPLHILARSSVHDMEVYRLIIEEYPSNLITEDKWRAIPLLYAFWGDAPAEIIQLLLESYQSLYPGHVFNWTMMVETIGRTDAPNKCIENLLRVKQMHFHEQSIDWEYLLDKFAQPSNFPLCGAPFHERMQFLVKCCVSLRVEALAFKVWRDCIANMIHTAVFVLDMNKDNYVILRSIQAQLSHFEDELPKLKQVTTILELALWKMRIDENCHEWGTTHCQKKIKNDKSSIRRHCRITCGADVIIGHVLFFLISTGDIVLPSMSLTPMTGAAMDNKENQDKK